MVYVNLYGSWLEIAVQLDLFVYVNRISLCYILYCMYMDVYIYMASYILILQAASTEEILNCDPGLHWLLTGMTFQNIKQSQCCAQQYILSMLSRYALYV